MIPLYTDEICKHIETIRIGLSILILRGYRPKTSIFVYEECFHKLSKQCRP